MNDRGTLTEASDGWRIRFERRLPHPPERVWRALSDPGQQGAWMPGVRIEPRVGGAVVYDFGDEGRADGEVLAVEQGKLLEHSWTWPDEPRAVVRWELRPDGDGTLLTLLHRPLRVEPARVYCVGWHAMLDALDVVLDGGTPADADYAALDALYQD
ncbi:SRPBCC family protein [Actinomadura sp. WMMB 499]|uniref:SRPBCC family protein n=1 Tax=Actinomadura sp. WMMB 499 TaxID=1219491 RepID=UPI001248FF6A|nr:SRPBCC family protein [Actinomadura sp. WMMB 499]QFG26406.1 SRPBCC family protein [Actinomadura sp. WMMB 499]